MPPWRVEKLEIPLEEETANMKIEEDRVLLSFNLAMNQHFVGRGEGMFPPLMAKFHMLCFQCGHHCYSNFGLQNHCGWWLQPWNLKMLIPWKESYDQPRQDIKKQRHYFANKCPSSQGYCFCSSHVWMWELDYKAECQRIDAFELCCWRSLLRSLGLQGDPTSPF